MASDIQTYLRELQAAMSSAGADPALTQDALFDAEEHLQAEMAGGGVVGRGTATYEARFAGAVEGYGTPDEVAAAYLGTAPAHEVVAAYETVMARAAAPTSDMAPTAEAVAVTEAAAVTEAQPVVEGLAAAEATVAEAAAMGKSPAGTGETASVFCRQCGRELPVTASFCRVCGTPVVVPPSVEMTAVREAPVAPTPLGAPTSPVAATPSYGQAPQYGAAPSYKQQYGAPPAGVQAGMAAAAAGAAAPPSFWRQVFGVFADAAVWKALVYMILSLGTGIAYFTIVVTGLSTAGGMVVLIVGIPLLVLVLGLVRALSLFEGRLVEWLLGARMPRRLRSAPPNAGFFERIWFWVKDGRTWASMAYMVLMLPLGIVYFTVTVTFLATGLGLLASPLWGWFGDHTFIIEGVTYDWWFPVWGIPLTFIAGVFLLVGTMHLIKWMGRGHAQFAKAMLVRLP